MFLCHHGWLWHSRRYGIWQVRQTRCLRRKQSCSSRGNGRHRLPRSRHPAQRTAEQQRHIAPDYHGQTVVGAVWVMSVLFFTPPRTAMIDACSRELVRIPAPSTNHPLLTLVRAVYGASVKPTEGNWAVTLGASVTSTGSSKCLCVCPGHEGCYNHL